MSIFNSLKIWWRGRSGEKTIKNYHKLLDPSEFLIIDGLSFDNTQKSIDNGALNTVQIDHCIFSIRTGVIFVVETKNVKGEITGDVSDKKWKLNTERGTFDIGNYLRQNYAHIRSIQNKLKENGHYVSNEKIQSIVFILEDKYKSKHHITNKSNQEGNAAHWFQPNCIVTNESDYLNLITRKTNEFKEKIWADPKLNTSEMKVRQQFNLFKDNNNTGFFDHIEHVQNIKRKHGI